MPHKTVFCLLGVSRNPANGFPARLLAACQLVGESYLTHYHQGERTPAPTPADDAAGAHGPTVPQPPPSLGQTRSDPAVAGLLHEAESMRHSASLQWTE